MKRFISSGKQRASVRSGSGHARARLSRFVSGPVRRLSKKGLKRAGFSVAGGGKISVRWNGRKTLVSVGGDASAVSHVFVLEGEPKRLVLVDRAVMAPGRSGVPVRISGSSMLPSDFAGGKRTPLIYSLAFFKPEQKVAFFDSLVWVQHSPSERVEAGASEPAEHIRGKGLGLFVSSCVREECFARGAKKLFGLVENRAFGSAANFRPVTSEERAIAEREFPAVREFLRSKDPVGRLMVSEIKP